MVHYRPGKDASGSRHCRQQFRSLGPKCLQQADGGRSTWAKEFEEEGGGPAGWADQFHRESHPPHAWADQFAAESSAEGWAEDFAAGQAQEFSEGLGAGDQGYAMASDNPFVSVS